MEEKKGYGQRIAALRRSANMLQEELGREIGVSRQTIAHYESENRAPDIQRIIALSEFFGVSCDYLLGVSVHQTYEASVEAMIDRDAALGPVFDAYQGDKDRDFIYFVFRSLARSLERWCYAFRKAHDPASDNGGIRIMILCIAIIDAIIGAKERSSSEDELFVLMSSFMKMVAGITVDEDSKMSSCFEKLFGSDDLRQVENSAMSRVERLYRR